MTRVHRRACLYVRRQARLALSCCHSNLLDLLSAHSNDAKDLTLFISTKTRTLCRRRRFRTEFSSNGADGSVDVICRYVLRPFDIQFFIRRQTSAIFANQSCYSVDGCSIADYDTIAAWPLRSTAVADDITPGISTSRRSNRRVSRLPSDLEHKTHRWHSFPL